MHLLHPLFCFAPRAPSLVLKCEGQNLHFSHISKAFNNPIFGDVTEPENSNVYDYWLRVFYSDRLEKSAERVNSRKRGVTRPFGNNLRSEPPSHC